METMNYMKNNEYEYDLEELIYMRNNITTYCRNFKSIRHHKIHYDEIIKGVIMYLDRIDDLIFTKMSEDNKNRNFNNFNVYKTEEK